MGKDKHQLAWNSGVYTSAVAKKHLLITKEYQCNICKLSTWNDKAIPLEIDHINGNSSDNSEQNLRLLCPNCHAQTSTYKARNKGNGRHYRKLRYHEGKSF